MKRLTLLTLALAGGAAFAAPKADVAKGKQIAQKVCAACHAADGNSGISTYPKLSAQHARYLAVQTAAIKEGKRTTGGAAAMKPMVMSLSEQDIADVAAFYAAQTPKSGEANPTISSWARRFSVAALPTKNCPPACPATAPAARAFRRRAPM